MPAVFTVLASSWNSLLQLDIRDVVHLHEPVERSEWEEVIVSHA